MRAQTAADRQAFYGVATWSVPVFSVLVPFVVLCLALHLFLAVGLAVALAVVLGGWLVARRGRASVAGLFVGLALGSAVALVGGLVTAMGFQP